MYLEQLEDLPWSIIGTGCRSWCFGSHQDTARCFTYRLYWAEVCEPSHSRWDIHAAARRLPCYCEWLQLIQLQQRFQVPLPSSCVYPQNERLRELLEEARLPVSIPDTRPTWEHGCLQLIDEYFTCDWPDKKDSL